MDFLGDHIASDYTISELAKKSGLSRPTVYSALDDLLARDLVVETRTLGTSRLFEINTDNLLIQAVLAQDFSSAAPTAARRKTRAKVTEVHRGTSMPTKRRAPAPR